MSFPNVIFGKYGDEKVVATSAIGGLPLGQWMVLPDAREFVHAQVGDTALVPGKVYQGQAVLAGTGWANDVAVVAGSAAVGATTLTMTASGTTAITADQFAGGFLFVASSTGAGIGYNYKIKSHAAAATTIAFTCTLEPHDPIIVAIAGGTATVGLRNQPSKFVVLTTADTVGVHAIAGVSCSSAAASTYVWLQKKGPAPVFTDATTPIVGIPVVASSTVAGAIATPVLTGTAINTVSVSKQALPLGICMTPAASAEYSFIDLNIP